MTIAIIIIFCTLLLIAYLFDLTSSRTMIPSVILLLITGWIVRQITGFIGMELPDFDPVLPIFGTIGLILIVLESALDLKLDRSKKSLITKSSLGAVLPMMALGFILAGMFYYFGGYTFQASLTNALPFVVISSTIALPSVRDLPQKDKDFVVYESSLSEIIGVLFFNFVALNTVYDLVSIGNFWLQIAIITVISFLATIALSFLLSKIEHEIKFGPIILLVILIYAVSKIYHLPALVFILMFGLFLANLDKIEGMKWIQRFRPELLDREVKKLKALVAEAAFVIKALFFLLFGYLIEAAQLFDSETLLWSVSIVVIIYFLRFIQLKISRSPLQPLLFVAPRGLITILLFLSISPAKRILLVNKSLVIQVIVLTTLIMMFGLMLSQRRHKKLERREELFDEAEYDEFLKLSEK